MVAQAAAPIITSSILAGGSLLSGLFGKKKVELPPEVRAAMQKLTDFYRTGRFGDFKAGEAYKQPFVDSKPTDIEEAGLGRLSSFVTGETPDIFNVGTGAIKDLLQGDKFDPYSPTGEFASFKENLNRELGDASTTLKRNAAYTGNLYSTSAMRDQAELAERGQELTAGKMAELYDKFVSRKLSAIPLALNAGGQQQALEMAPIQASQQFGGLKRELETSRLAATYNDFLRRRDELKLPISAATTLAGGGPTSASIPNAFSGVLNQVGSVGIQELIRQLFSK